MQVFFFLSFFFLSPFLCSKLLREYCSEKDEGLSHREHLFLEVSVRFYHPRSLYSRLSRAEWRAGWVGLSVGQSSWTGG